MSRLMVPLERQELQPDDMPLLYAQNKFTLNHTHPYALTFARISFRLGLITTNINLCTPLLLQNPDNAPVIVSAMQELRLDRILGLSFDESPAGEDNTTEEQDNGGYGRRWACHPWIVDFWGHSQFWEGFEGSIKQSEENNVARRVRWQNIAVERARYEIAMLRLRILFHRGRQYLEGGQKLRRLQRRRVRKTAKEVDGSWGLYEADLESYPRAVDWAVCETPREEPAFSLVAAARERDSLPSREMTDGANEELNIDINVDGMLWKWDPSCCKWVALEALDVELDTFSGGGQNEGLDENEEKDGQCDWIENFLGPPEVPPRRDVSSVGARNEGLNGNKEVGDRSDCIENFLGTRKLFYEEPNTFSGEVQNEGRDWDAEVEVRPSWIENFLDTRVLSQGRLEFSAATPDTEISSNTPKRGDLLNGWTIFSQRSGGQPGYDGTGEYEQATPSTEDAATSSGEVQNDGHDENEEVAGRQNRLTEVLGTRVESPRRVNPFAAKQEGELDKIGQMVEQGATELQKKERLEMTEDSNLTTHGETILEMLQREMVREPAGVEGSLLEQWAGLSHLTTCQQDYDGAAELEQATFSREQDIFEKLQKLILQPETSVYTRLKKLRQLTTYGYTNENRAKWTEDDWSASREFWASEPWPLVQVLEAQKVVPASDSTSESLLLDLIKVGDLKSVLGGQKRTDRGVGLQNDDMKLTASLRTTKQLGVLSQPDDTTEEQLIEIIQKEDAQGVMGEPKPVKKVGWILGRMVFYNPEEEELGNVCVRKICRSTAREKCKQSSIPPISLTSFTCHKSTAKQPANNPDRPCQISVERPQLPKPASPIGSVSWTEQPHLIALYHPRHLSLPTKLVGTPRGTTRPSSGGTTRGKPSSSDPILGGAPLALLHPDPVALYSEWAHSRTYASAAFEPASVEVRMNPAMKTIGRQKKDAEHESSATEQDQKNVMADEQRVFLRGPGMARVQSMRELFQLRASKTSIGVAVEECYSRRPKGMAGSTEKRIAFLSSPPPSPHRVTPSNYMHESKSRGRGTGRGRDLGSTYREREFWNEQRSESGTRKGQSIIPVHNVAAIATEDVLPEIGGAQLAVDKPDWAMNDAKNEPTAPEQNRNNVIIIDQVALNEELAWTNNGHTVELSQLDAYCESLDVAVADVNSRQNGQKYSRNEGGRHRGRNRGGTFRKRYPRKWQQMQNAANVEQHVISKPGSSTQGISVEMTEQELKLKAIEEQPDHPPISFTSTRVEQLSRLASLGLEDYVSDISEEDTDGEAPPASSYLDAYANARSLIAEELVRVLQSGLTSVQTWAPSVQRETPQEHPTQVEAKVQGAHQDATKALQQPQNATKEVREIVPRPRIDRGKGRDRGKGSQSQPRQGRHTPIVEIEGQDIISKPASIPGIQDFSRDNERRHICTFEPATARGPDATARILAQRTAIRDRLVSMSDKVADKGAMQDQRIRMRAAGWCKWVNWKDRGGMEGYSFDKEGSLIDFLNPVRFRSHLRLGQPAFSAVTPSNASVSLRNSIAASASSASARPPYPAPAISSSVLSIAEQNRFNPRKLKEACELRCERTCNRYDAIRDETYTEDSTEKPLATSSQDKGKFKAGDFTGDSIFYAKGLDTTSEDTALVATELDEVERIDDAQEGSASSDTNARNTPAASGNFATHPMLASTAPTSFSSFMSEAEILHHMKGKRVSAERKAKKKAAATKAEANTKDETEMLFSFAPQDKCKMKANDFRSAPLPYNERHATTSDDTALEVTELEGVKRTTNDAGQGTAFTAANTPIQPENSDTPPASSTSAVSSSIISTAAPPDNWFIRLMRKISPNHHERSRPNTKVRAKKKALAKVEAKIEDKMEKAFTSLSRDKGKDKATNFTGALAPISNDRDEMKATERNQIDEMIELGGSEAVTADSIKGEGDAHEISQTILMVALAEEKHHTREESSPSAIRDATEPRPRSDSTRRAIWCPIDPVAYENFGNAEPQPLSEMPEARAEHDRAVEVPFGMVEIDGSLECIGEVEKAEDEAHRMGQDEMFGPN